MDYNGNDTTTGGGGITPGEDACFGDLRGEKLIVGTCDSIVYQLPENGPSNKGVIVSGGQTIEFATPDNNFRIGYTVGLTSYLRTVPIPEGVYTFDQVRIAAADAVNLQIAADGGTNGITLVLNPTGKVEARFSDGNINSIALSSFEAWALLGNTTPGGVNIPKTTSREFLSLPNYTGVTKQSSWYNYKFDDTGTVFSGDMTVTGSLEVKSLVSDIEVEDSLITINKNQPVNNFSSGLVINEFNNTRFSGLIKAANSSDFYLFSNSAILPTASGWAPEFTGNLFMTRIGVNNNTGTSQMDVKSPGGAVPSLTVDAGPLMTERLQVWRQDGAEVASMNRFGVLTCSQITTSILSATAPVTLGNIAGAGQYIMPLERGTERQVIKINDAGSCSFATNDQIESPDGTTTLSITNTNVSIVDSGITRLDVANVVTDVISPSGVSRIRVFNDRIETNVRTKTLANFEVSGQAFVGQLIGGAQSNVYSTTNSRVGLCVDLPAASTALNTVFAKDNILQASIDNNGKAFFPVVTTQNIDAAAAGSLVIGDTTANAVDISKSGDTTTVKGALVVQEGLNLGVAPNNYSIPVIKGLEGQYLEADASGNLQFGNHEFYASLQAENNFQITLTNQNQYYPPQNATVNSQSLDFVPIPPSGFQYNKANSRFVKADFHASIEQASAGAGNIINIAVLVNGVRQQGRSRARIDNTNPYPIEVSLSTVFLVNNGDIISVAVECETAAGVVVDIYSYSFVISKV